jgi:peptidoglycan/LPS O-acetylase OafA/YrhL
MGERKALTALRGVFALWVLSYHLVVLSPSPLPNLAGLFAKGYLGVDFFFLLSGFVLAGAYGEKFANAASWSRYRGFMISRAGRMYPLHVTVTLVCVAVAWWYGKPYSPVQVFEETLLIHRWPGVHAIFQAINGPAWSISTEILANITFPIFVYATLVARPLYAAIFGGLCAGAVLYLGLQHDGSLDLTRANTLAPSIRCFSEFGIGMLTYRWRGRKFATSTVAIIGMTLLAASLILGLPDQITIALMILLILALSEDQSHVGRLLSVRPLHYLGELSFSIYLVHFPVLVAVRAYVASNWAFVLGTVAITLFISAVTYPTIESRFRDWSKALAKRSIPDGLTISRAVVDPAVDEKAGEKDRRGDWQHIAR